jgi:hypothetical protein
VVIAPAAGAHPNITAASASIDTPGGLVLVDWTQKSSGGGNCEVAPEHSNAQLTCVAGGGKSGLFTGVTFASFGTPTGSCPGPFAKSSCDAATSVAVVAKACVGQSSCSIAATTDNFGGDPCVNVLKQLAVIMAGDCAEIKYQITTQIPLGSVSDVIVSTMGAGAANAAVFEGNVTVWANGAYTPGSPGVTGAEASSDGSDVIVHTESGRYKFAIVADA